VAAFVGRADGKRTAIGTEGYSLTGVTLHHTTATEMIRGVRIRGLQIRRLPHRQRRRRRLRG